MSQSSSSPVFSQTPTIIPLTTAVELVQSRKVKFENTLSIEIDRNSISFNRAPNSSNISGFISLNVVFHNEGDSPISFRKPQLPDLLRPLGSGSINDLVITIMRDDGKEMMFDRMGNGVVDYEQVSENDYIQIIPRNKYVFPIELELSWVYIPEDEYIGEIPAGRYVVIATYENYTLGYELPLLETPPANLDLDQMILWNQNNRKVIDLNAWIGTIWSERVEFVISE